MRKTKSRILSLITCLSLCLSLLLNTTGSLVQASGASDAMPLLHSGDLSKPPMSASEIAALLDATGQSSLPANVFDEVPTYTAPYRAGKLSQEALNASLARLNAIRAIAGLPAVVMDAGLNELAQHGAMLLAVNDTIEHYPKQPADMPDDIYQKAYQGTANSNVHGYNLIRSIDDYMPDPGNPDLGHRFWQLSTGLSVVGFGFAQNIHARMCEYVTGKAGYSVPSFEWDFIGWPSSGNFPTNNSIFRNNSSWSVQLNSAKYARVLKENLTVRLTQLSDNTQWLFNSTQADGYFNAFNNKVIFRPNISEPYSGAYRVEILGLTDTQGNPVQFAYESRMFNLDAIPLTESMFTVDTSPVTYHGGQQTKSVSGQDGNTTLVELRDYEVSYQNNVNAGTATLTISGLGKYSGTLNYEFPIQPAIRTFYAAPTQNTIPLTGSDTISLLTDNCEDTGRRYSFLVANPDILTLSTVDGGEKATLTPKALGETVVLVTAHATANYQEQVLEVPVRVTDLPLQTLSFPEDTKNGVSKNYGDAPFAYQAVAPDDGGVVYYYSSDETVARVDAAGTVTLLKPGTAFIYAEAAEVPGQWAPTRTMYQLEVEKMSIVPSPDGTTLLPKVYDGSPSGTVDTMTFLFADGTTGQLPKDDYTTSVEYSDAEAGEGKTATIKVSLNMTGHASYYSLQDDTVTIPGVVIDRASAPKVSAQSVSIRYNNTEPQTVNLAGLMPADANIQGYTLTIADDPQTLIESWTTDAKGNPVVVLKQGLTHDTQASARLQAVIQSRNYEDVAVEVSVLLKGKDVPKLTLSADKTALTGAGTVTFTVGGLPAGATASVTAKPSVSIKQDGGKYVVQLPNTTRSYTFTVSFAGDDIYEAATATCVVNVTGKGSSGGGSSSGGGGGGSTGGGGYTGGGYTGGGYTGGGSGSGTGSTQRENPFVDVSKDSYYVDAVLWALEKGITTGLTATTFGPDQSCTRAQMATFLWRAMGSPQPRGNRNPFTDVPADAYYAKAVQWAYEQKITGGTSATTFSPNDVCSRAQMATFLWRTTGSPAPINNVNPFVDVSADTYYAKAVQWACTTGITNGTGSATFSPDATCTRGQMVTFLWRYSEK